MNLLIYVLTVSMLTSSWLQVRANVTDRRRKNFQPMLELVMNEKTNFTTAYCFLQSRINVVLLFKKVKDLKTDLKTFYIHALEKGTNRTETFDPCNWHQEDNGYYCPLWKIRKAFAMHKYKIWATRDKDPSKERIWKYRTKLEKSFLLAKHVFGCLNTNIKNLKTTVHQDTVTVKWDVISTMIYYYEPRFEVVIDNEVYTNTTETTKTIKKSEIGKCTPHKICIRTKYGKAFLTKYLKSHGECIESQLWNCTVPVHEPSTKHSISISKNEWFVLASVILVSVLLAFIVFWYCKRNRKKQKKNRRSVSENADNDPILPRNKKAESTDTYFNIQPMTSRKYAEIDESGNVASSDGNESNLESE